LLDPTAAIAVTAAHRGRGVRACVRLIARAWPRLQVHAPAPQLLANLTAVNELSDENTHTFAYPLARVVMRPMAKRTASRRER
jgi:hypothetical protein